MYFYQRMTLSCYYNNAARYYSQVCSRNPVIVLRFNIGAYGWQGKGRTGGIYRPALYLVE